MCHSKSYSISLNRMLPQYRLTTIVFRVYNSRSSYPASIHYWLNILIPLNNFATYIWIFILKLVTPQRPCTVKSCISMHKLMKWELFHTLRIVIRLFVHNFNSKTWFLAKRDLVSTFWWRRSLQNVKNR